MLKFMKDNEAWKSNMDMWRDSHDLTIRELKNQIGHLATIMSNRTQGALSSNTELNPKRDGNEHCKVITLRSSKGLEGPTEEKASQPQGQDKEKLVKESVVVDLNTPMPPVPFPQRLQKAREEKQFSKF